MKILFYSDSFGNPNTTFINNEILFLSKKHTLLYLCNNFTHDFTAPNLTIKEIPFKWNRFLKKIHWKLWMKDIYMSFKEKNFSKALNTEIETFKPDIIHCHFGFEAMKVLENIKDKSIPVILHFHGYGASKMIRKKSFVKKLKLYLSQENIYPIFVNKHFLNRFIDLKINTKNHLILYYGINLSEFSGPAIIPPKNKTIIFLQVSSLVPKKGHEYTITAFANLVKKKKITNVKLILTGDGPRKTKLQALVNDLNISDFVIFSGNVSRKRVNELMTNADIFLHHSVTDKEGSEEGIPNAIIEAMAMKLPVISTFHSGIPELVENNVNGILVKEKDINTYTEAMQKILSWKHLEINRKKVSEKFNLKKHNEILEKFYYNILSKKDDSF